LQMLTPAKIRLLRKNGSVLIGSFRIEHVQAKWLQITQYGPKYKDGDKNDKFTVRIADMFGFFQCSFVKALYANIPDHPLIAPDETTVPFRDKIGQIEAGKGERNNFTYAMIDYIESYWETEIRFGQ